MANRKAMSLLITSIKHAAHVRCRCVCVGRNRKWLMRWRHRRRR